MKSEDLPQTAHLNQSEKRLRFVLKSQYKKKQLGKKATNTISTSCNHLSVVNPTLPNKKNSINVGDEDDEADLLNGNKTNNTCNKKNNAYDINKSSNKHNNNNKNDYSNNNDDTINSKVTKIYQKQLTQSRIMQHYSEISEVPDHKYDVHLIRINIGFIFV
eukprot:Pgem_evm1s1102